MNKNLSVVNDYSDEDNITSKTIIDTTKTESGTRTVPLSRQAAEAIERQKENTSEFTFIFSSNSGTPLEKRNIYKAFNKVVERANVKSSVTFHSFRHSFATRLLENGADIKTTSELLGHKSIQITFDIYSHVGKDLKQQTINLLNA